MRLEVQDLESDLHAGAVVAMTRRAVAEKNSIAGAELDLIMPIWSRKEAPEGAELEEYTFNPSYLIDALEHVPSDLVQFRWNKAEAAFMLAAI